MLVRHVAPFDHLEISAAMVLNGCASSGTQVISDNMMSVSRVKEDSLAGRLPPQGGSSWYGGRLTHSGCPCVTRSVFSNSSGSIGQKIGCP